MPSALKVAKPCSTEGRLMRADQSLDLSAWSGGAGNSPLERPANMVHHTIAINTTKANKASSKINHMSKFPFIAWPSAGAAWVSSGQRIGLPSRRATRNSRRRVVGGRIGWQWRWGCRFCRRCGKRRNHWHCRSRRFGSDRHQQRDRQLPNGKDGDDAERD